MRYIKKKLKNVLEKNHDIVLSKYKLENLTWIGVQRNDIITQRKQFLWTIKKIHDES